MIVSNALNNQGVPFIGCFCAISRCEALNINKINSIRHSIVY